MDTDELLLSLHLLAATIWVGGGVMVDIQAARALRSDDPARMAGFLSDAGFVGQRIFAPASLILLLAGFGLIAEVDYDFDVWIIVALAVWLFSFIIGMAYFGPEGNRLAEMVERGDTAGEFQSRLSRLATLSRVETALLLLVVVDMAIKPGL